MKLIVVSSIRCWSIACLLLCTLSTHAQWQPDVKLRLGLNSFSYLADSRKFGEGPAQLEYFINTQITTPVLGLELNWPDYNLSVVGSYYMALITHPSRDPYNYDIQDVKYAGAVDLVYNWESFRLGLILVTRDYRRAGVYLGGDPSENIQRGFGLSFGFPVQGFEFELRKEMIWAADNKYTAWGGGYLSWFDDAWNLRLSYPIDIYSPRENSDNTKIKNKFALKSGLNVHAGFSITGNPNYDITLQTSRSIIPITYGLEYFYKPYRSSIFYRRTNSLKISVWDGVANEYIQNNYLGYAYWHKLSDRRFIKFEINHNWAFNRLPQVLINEELLANNADPSEYLGYGEYDNRSIGLGVRYPINYYMDVFSNLDIYYKANYLSKKGYAPNSLSVGLMFHFQPR